jgi:DNA-binding CsgD family transcriptional regulator
VKFGLTVLKPGAKKQREILWQTHLAAELLESYFPGAEGHWPFLPGPMDEWLKAGEGSLRARSDEPDGEPFRACREGWVLTVCFHGDGGNGGWLVLSEELGTETAGAAWGLGLTEREREILHWMSEGKTNPEIAIILAIRPRTVEKHVEHILIKLGVHTRSAAVRECVTGCLAMGKRSPLSAWYM